MKRFLEKMKDLSGSVEEEAVQSCKEMPVKKGPKKNTDPNSTKIIIVSDNHMKTDGLKKVLEYHADEADYFLHCGDSNLNHDHEMMKSFITVKGNTDCIQKYQVEEEVRLANGELIWIVHGHAHQVARGVDALLQSAKMSESVPSIILYGHTHMIDVQMIDGCLIINPGSISVPRDGIICTYAKLVVMPESYDVTILDVKDHSVVKEFQFPR